jgi:hypothetical protein
VTCEATLHRLLSKVEDEVASYFRSLGFVVTWDFRKRDGLDERWYEIYDGDAMLVQIDFGAPLAEIQEDLPVLAAGAALGTSKGPLWMVRGSIEDLKRVVVRMK